MKVSSNGIELNCTVQGSGPWVVMSHSLACDLHMWDGQAALLANDYTVLRFDTRGHGESDAPAGEYTLEMVEKAGRGTEVTLHLREGDDEFADGNRLRTILRKYSDHITLPILIYQQVSGVFNFGFAGALGLILLLVSLAIVLAYHRAMTRVARGVGV